MPSKREGLCIRCGQSVSLTSLLLNFFFQLLPLRYILKDAFINRLRTVAYFRGCISDKR